MCITGLHYLKENVYVVVEAATLGSHGALLRSISPVVVWELQLKHGTGLKSIVSKQCSTYTTFWNNPTYFRSQSQSFRHQKVIKILRDCFITSDFGSWKFFEKQMIFQSMSRELCEKYNRKRNAHEYKKIPRKKKIPRHKFFSVATCSEIEGLVVRISKINGGIIQLQNTQFLILKRKFVRNSTMYGLPWRTKSGLSGQRKQLAPKSNIPNSPQCM